MADTDDEAIETAKRIERDNPRWIIIFGAYTKQFCCLPRFRVPPWTFVVARYPGAIPPRMRQIEGLFLRPTVCTYGTADDSRAAEATCNA